MVTDISFDEQGEVEYCEFERNGIEDRPLTPDENYSQFPSNTNILF